MRAPSWGVNPESPMPTTPYRDVLPPSAEYRPCGRYAAVHAGLPLVVVEMDGTPPSLRPVSRWPAGWTAAAVLDAHLVGPYPLAAGQRARELAEADAAMLERAARVGRGLDAAAPTTT